MRLTRTRIFVRIYLNSKLVHTTADAQLQNDSTVKWAQIFNIYVLSSTLETDSIVLEIYEHSDGSAISTSGSSRGREHLVAELCVPTPDPASTTYALDDFEFASQTDGFYFPSSASSIQQQQQSQHNNNEHVGAGGGEMIYTSGEIRAGARWAQVDLVRKDALIAQAWRQREEKLNSNDPLMAVGVSHMQDIDQLAKWVQRSNLDPNDPRNADLINLIKV